MPRTTFTSINFTACENGKNSCQVLDWRGHKLIPVLGVFISVHHHLYGHNLKLIHRNGRGNHLLLHKTLSKLNYHGLSKQRFIVGNANTREEHLRAWQAGVNDYSWRRKNCNGKWFTGNNHPSLQVRKSTFNRDKRNAMGNRTNLLQ